MNEDKYTIPVSFLPDYVQAYQFNYCDLCKKKMKKDPNFKSSSCIHCDHKIMMWSSKRETNEKT